MRSYLNNTSTHDQQLSTTRPVNKGMPQALYYPSATSTTFLMPHRNLKQFYLQVTTFGISNADLAILNNSSSSKISASMTTNKLTQ